MMGDHVIDGWQKAGLLLPSLATGIIRTIRQEMIYRRLGAMPSTDMQAIENVLRQTLGLTPETPEPFCR